MRLLTSAHYRENFEAEAIFKIMLLSSSKVLIEKVSPLVRFNVGKNGAVDGLSDIGAQRHSET